MKAAVSEAGGADGARGSQGSLGAVGQTGRVGSGGFYTGQRVRVRGLERNTFPNGVQGVLLEPEAEKPGMSRWRVQLDPEILAVPRFFEVENLESFEAEVCRNCKGRGTTFFGECHVCHGSGLP